MAPSALAVAVASLGNPIYTGKSGDVVRLAYQESERLRRVGGFDIGAKFFRVARITVDVEKNKIVGVRSPQRACFADVRSALHVCSQLPQHPSPQVASDIVADD